MSRSSTIRVVLVDDHKMILESLARLLRDDSQIVVVGQALTAEEGLEVTQREMPDVVIIDYTLPDMDAPDAIKMLRDVCPEVKIITLSGSDRPGALFASKRAGSSAWVTKTRAIQELREAVLRVAAGLPVASDELEALPPLDQLVVHYQPVVEFSTMRTVAFEALIRWQHPERGLLHPDAFLPLAEATGFIVEIDKWIWEQAAFQLRDWQGLFPREQPIRMGVNVSASDLSDPDLFNGISDIVRRSGLDASDLVFEITESVLLEDNQDTAHLLTQLKQLGADLALDDFGTAFSSLSYVRRFPFDHLKLDISFTSELPGSTRCMLLVEEICHLAKSMEMTIIAEGIERPEQMEALSGLGCDFGQGYLFSRPLSAARCAERLAGEQ